MEQMSSLCGYREGPEEYSTADVRELTMRRAEETICHLHHLLIVTRQERDEARDQLHHLLATLARPHLLNHHVSDDPTAYVYDRAADEIEKLAMNRPLPEKGRMREAMEKIMLTPMLSTLLVAGALPRWQNPPPLRAIRVPPSELCATAMENQRYVMQGSGFHGGGSASSGSGLGGQSLRKGVEVSSGGGELLSHPSRKRQRSD